MNWKCLYSHFFQKEYLVESVKAGGKFTKDFTVANGDELFNTCVHYEFKTIDNGIKYERYTNNLKSNFN